ncbi:MAG: LysE family transporter [Bacillota bacterium]|nr:LysE family transporter [Bacillota bacterium]
MSNLFILVVKALANGFITGAIVAVPMGPSGVESIRRTLIKGLKQGMLVETGALLSDAVDIILINFGLLDLLEKNKPLQIFFWLLSGLIVFFIGFNAVRKGKSPGEKDIEDAAVNKRIKGRPVFTGFIINFTNPMTHFFWLTISSTIMRVWKSSGQVPYFTYSIAMLAGMFFSLLIINYLAVKGKRFKVPKLPGKASGMLAYVIVITGMGFLSFGLYNLYLYV